MPVNLKLSSRTFHKLYAEHILAINVICYKWQLSIWAFRVKVGTLVFSVCQIIFAISPDLESFRWSTNTILKVCIKTSNVSNPIQPSHLLIFEAWDYFDLTTNWPPRAWNNLTGTRLFLPFGYAFMCFHPLPITASTDAVIGNRYMQFLIIS